ncbi:MAG: amidophosphoribosyltransferase [Candidatus Saccharibacteria bacterium]|nr:amidophosphoribosyltransferase [Candidatus Saccharibacteria bacterium]
MTHELEPASPEAHPVDIEYVEFMEKPQDECGVYGVFAPGEEVAEMTYQALRKLQHRGQSGAGVSVWSDEFNRPQGHKDIGLVQDALKPIAPSYSIALKRVESPLDEWTKSPVAIGHVRYSTADSNSSAQPFWGERVKFALAHNGHMETIEKVADKLSIDVSKATSDSNVLSMLIDARAAELGTINEALAEVLPLIDGAYCLSIMDKEQLIGVRDPWGTHPLVLGELKNGSGYVIASETRGLDASVEFIRDIEPGEIVTITKDGLTSSFIERPEPKRMCMYEHIYIGHKLSTIEGVVTYEARKNMGRSLFHEAPVEADIVVPVPSSGIAAAIGFAEASGLPIAMEGLVQNDTARSFLYREGERDKLLVYKLEANPSELAGKRVVFVDDSAVKGSVSTVLYRIARDAGATEVHFRFSAPKFKNSCYSGMDTRDTRRLLAHGRNLVEMAEKIGADSVGFNTVENIDLAIQEAVAPGRTRRLGEMCTACATGEYPFPVPSSVHLGMPKMRTEMTPIELAQAI